MPKVDLDEDVYAELQARATPFEDSPSDVIRGLLRAATRTASSDPTVVPSARSGVPNRVMVGKLDGLLKAGLIAPGDKLIHERKRTGRLYEASVTKRGCILLPDGRWFREPSPALREFVSTQIDGWANWVHEPSGRTLRDLRDNG